MVHRASDEKHIRGSPFSINVGDTELAHAPKVHVSGATSNAKANCQNSVIVDTNGAGMVLFPRYALNVNYCKCTVVEL